MMVSVERRPPTLLIAASLLLIIGLSGLSAGVSLILAVGSARDAPWVAVAIGAAIGTYGAVTTFAGIGLLVLFGWGWWLGTVSIGAGLLFQVGMVVVLGGLDPVVAFGLLVWSLTLACLAARGTRDVVGVRLRR